MKKILVINVNWVGDAVFSTPIFKALKQNFPQAQISCLAVPRVREVLEQTPGVDTVIIYDEEGKDCGPWAKLKLIARLRQEKFDAVFILHRSMTRALLVYLAGIPQRVGYDTKNRGMFLTKRIPQPTVEMHRSDYYLKVLESSGIKVKDRICELRSDVPESEKMDALLKAHGVLKEDFVVAVHVGGNWDLKRWPKENFALLIKHLSRRYQAKVVIPGTSADVPLVQEIAAQSTVNPVVLAGQTDLKALMALLKRADLVISSDSGPIHIASSLGADVIGLFGPTRPEVTGPRGKGRTYILQKDVGCNRHPCYHLQCADNICVQSITVQDVLDTVKKIRDQ